MFLIRSPHQTLIHSFIWFWRKTLRTSFPSRLRLVCEWVECSAGWVAQVLRCPGAQVLGCFWVVVGGLAMSQTSEVATRDKLETQESSARDANGGKVQENPGDRTKHLSSAHRPLSPSSLVFASCISISHCQLAIGWVQWSSEKSSSGVMVAWWLGWDVCPEIWLADGYGVLCSVRRHSGCNLLIRQRQRNF